MTISLAILCLLFFSYFRNEFRFCDVGSGSVADCLLLASSKVIAPKSCTANELRYVSDLSKTGYCGTSEPSVGALLGHPVVASDGRWCSTSSMGDAGG